MEINIKPEEIDVYVKQAIIESSIGKIINDSATKYMNEFISQSWDSPVKKIIQMVVTNLIEEIIKRPDNLAIIEKAVVDKFTPEHVTNTVYAIVDKLQR